MRVLIVDDEPPARSRLRRLLAAFAGVEVVGEAADAAGALAAVATLAPQVLMLDVQMPGASGLDLAASLPEPAPLVVFVSAHGHYALPAFDAAAIDYLLKPVEPERLARALERVRERLERVRERLERVRERPEHTPLQRVRERQERAGRHLAHAAPPAPQQPAPQHLLIPDRGGVQVLRCDEILWLEAADNYVAVHTAGRTPLLRRTLATLLADLGPGFVRTHRGAAVALAQVQAVLAREHGEAEVLLRGGQRAPCSRGHRAALTAALTAALAAASAASAATPAATSAAAAPSPPPSHP